MAPDEVTFKTSPLLRIKPRSGFAEPPPGAEVHLNTEGMCVDSHLVQLVVNLLTKVLNVRNFPLSFFILTLLKHTHRYHSKET